MIQGTDLKPAKTPIIFRQMYVRESKCNVIMKYICSVRLPPF